MAASTELKPRDVVNALQTLEDNQLKELFYHLEVPLPTLNSISAQNMGNMRKINYVETWFNNDVKASWKKIIAGLEHINMNALAHKLALKYGLRRDATSVSISPSPDLTASPVTAPVATDTQTTASLLTTIAITPPSSLTTTPSAAAGLQTTALSVATMAITTPSSLSASFPVTAPAAMDPQPATLSLTPSSSSGLSLMSVAVADDQQHTPPGQPLVSSVACPTPTSDRVSQVRANINQLDDTFADLMLDTQLEMCTKESRDPTFLKRFRLRLLGLPVAKKATHTKFFRESEDEFLKAANMEKIFAILNRYCSYRNYEILLHVVKKFCEAMLQWKMQQYCQALESFEKATTVDIYLLAISACQELSFAFIQMTMKIKKPASICTLYEVRNFKEAVAERASLHSYSMYVDIVTERSVVVALQFHNSCLGWVLAALTPDFLHAHLLSDMAVSGEKITSQQRSQEELNDELITASEAGDVVRVVSLLNGGADINTVDRLYSQTALNRASEYGHLQVVRFLLHRGAEVECRDQEGYTPLITASWEGRCDVVIDLLDSGADVNDQDNYGNSALMEAVRRGHTETIKELVKAKANLDLQNNNGDSALMTAAYYGRTETIKELVKAKANLDLQNYKGDSAVIRAAARYRPDALRVLVGAGSDLNLQNEEGLTALMIAARSWGSDITDILLEGEHIDLDIQENSTGWSALFFSAERGDVATTQSLLTAGANVHLKDKNGLSVLEVARAKEDEWEQQRHSYRHRYEHCNYERVIELLSQYIEEPAAPPSHITGVDSSSTQQTDVSTDDDPYSDEDSTLTQQDSSTDNQDNSPLQQDPSTDVQDTPSTDQDSSAASDQIISTAGQRRRRRRVPRVTEALRNLVNVSGQRIQQIFNQLDRRLKSADKKTQSGVRDQGRDRGQKTKRPPDNQTTSTTDTRTVNV